MRRSRSARVARRLKSEVGSRENARVLSPRRLLLTQSRRGAEAAELCVRIYGGPVPVESLWLSEQPIMTGNFDVDAEIYSELSKSK